MRGLPLVLVLAACSQTCPPAFTVSPAHRASLPPTPPPGACVEDWYAKADTPACVDAWIDGLAAHRKKVRGKK